MWAACSRGRRSVRAGAGAGARASWIGRRPVCRRLRCALCRGRAGTGTGRGSSSGQWQGDLARARCLAVCVAAAACHAKKKAWPSWLSCRRRPRSEEVPHGRLRLRCRPLAMKRCRTNDSTSAAVVGPGGEWHHDGPNMDLLACPARARFAEKNRMIRRHQSTMSCFIDAEHKTTIVVL